MPKFLIEVPHSNDVVECAHTVKIFMETGSHFLTHADWGCHDGVHKAWLTVDVADKTEALHIVPTAYRAHANIVQLNKFTVDEIDQLLRDHQGTA